VARNRERERERETQAAAAAQAAQADSECGQCAELRRLFSSGELGFESLCERVHWKEV
jgi:hypothetical protein